MLQTHQTMHQNLNNHCWVRKVAWGDYVGDSGPRVDSEINLQQSRQIPTCIRRICFQLLQKRSWNTIFHSDFSSMLAMSQETKDMKMKGKKPEEIQAVSWIMAPNKPEITVTKTALFCFAYAIIFIVIILTHSLFYLPLTYKFQEVEQRMARKLEPEIERLKAKIKYLENHVFLGDTTVVPTMMCKLLIVLICNTFANSSTLSF